MKSLFVSYCHKDMPFVTSLVRDLKYLGTDLWIDKAEINVGDSLIEKIRSALDAVNYVGAVISKNSISSPWVQRELDVAMNREIDGANITVLPILLDHVDLPGFLLGKAYADFRTNDKYYSGLSNLVSSLDLDLDPISEASLPGEPHWTPTEYSNKVRRELYNRLGMMIMKWASDFDDQPTWWMMPEQWRRADDAVTNAYDAGDSEYIQHANRYLKEWDERISVFSHLYTPRGLLYREAFKLFKEASALGDLEAMWNLGWRYELGQGVKKSHDNARFFWRRAAHYGHEASIQKLANEGK